MPIPLLAWCILGSVDERIAALAGRQHGVVSVAQLAALGVTRDAIRHRVRRRLLTPLHFGVYRLGPGHSPFADLMAATLACGPTAVLSHHSAAALLGIRRPRPGPVHVTVTRGHARKRKGLVVHRTRTLRPDEITTHNGIRTTTAARTLLDIATDLPRQHLKRAVEEAQIQGHLDGSSLADAVSRAGGHRGVAALRAAAPGEARLTRSEAERRLLELIRAAELPEPATNRRVGRWEVDAVWENERLVVEVDGFAFHGGREAFERDRVRDAELVAAGWRVQRVTWRQIVDEPVALVARLARGLSAAPAPVRPPAAAAPPGSPPGPRRW